MNRILYITSESLELDPILTSQVLSLFDSLDSTYDIKLVTFESKDFISRNLNSKSNIFIQRSSLFYSILRLIKWVFFNFNTYDIIHVRSYLPMFSILLPRLFFSKPIIFDMRGVMPYEFRLRSKTISSLFYKAYYYFAFLLFLLFEYIFIRISSAIVVVSTPFAQYVQGKIFFKTPIFVIPTFASPNKDFLTYKDNPYFPLFPNLSATIFVYSGSLDVWQQFTNTILLFQLIQEKLPNSKLIVLTRQTELATELIFDTLPTDSYKVISVLPSQVSSVLALGDFGFLLRESDIVNAVSAPIKFAEYLSSGLRVIISSGIGDASNQVQKHDLGFVLDSLDSHSFITFISKHYKELNFKSSSEPSAQVASFLNSNYSLDQAVIKYQQLYKQLLSA